MTETSTVPQRPSGTPRVRRRERTGSECAIHGCRKSAIARREASVSLCPMHVRQIRSEISNYDNGATGRCVWTGCLEYVTWPNGLALCEKHVARTIELATQDSFFIRRTKAFKKVLGQEAARQISRDRQVRKAAQKREEKAREAASVVYIVRSGGYYKIGWTSDLAKRMRTYPPDSRLMAVMPGTRKDETHLHKRFAHLRSHGREWFSLHPDIDRFIKATVAEHGEPDPVEFSAKPREVPMPHRINKINGPKPRGFVGK